MSYVVTVGAVTSVLPETSAASSALITSREGAVISVELETSDMRVLNAHIIVMLGTVISGVLETSAASISLSPAPQILNLTLE